MTIATTPKHTASVRTRFAPSPTGYLHIGGLRTALYSFLFARHYGGEFYLRIEDTDRSRYVAGAEKNLQESLKWANLTWDNSEIVFQSRRLPIYKKYAEQLVTEKKAYHCFCSSEELDVMRKEQQEKKLAPKYDRRCLSLSPEDVKKKISTEKSYVIRFHIPDKDTDQIEYSDAIRGRVSFRTELLDDQVILKSDGFPTYHLASVIDDHEMEISHVIRGEEWLPSTPKHILLYRAFGWKVPIFAHLPLLLNPDRSKLSKRQGDVAVEDYVQKGYLKEAIINFVSLLGWNPGKGSEKEIFSLEELIKNFSLEQVNKAGAIFDIKRLDWMNGEYIKRMTIDDLYKKAQPFLSKYPEVEEKYWKRIISVEQDRLNRLDQVGEKSPFFFVDPEYNSELLRWKDMKNDALKMMLTKAQTMIQNISEEDWNRQKLGEIFLAEAGEQRGEFLWPLRVALTGAKQSPPPQDIAWIIGKETTLKRIGVAIFLTS